MSLAGLGMAGGTTMTPAAASSSARSWAAGKVAALVPSRHLGDK